MCKAHDDARIPSYPRTESDQPLRLSLSEAPAGSSVSGGAPTRLRVDSELGVGRPGALGADGGVLVGELAALERGAHELLELRAPGEGEGEG